MNATLIPTKELLNSMPKLKESTLRSLIRRKYVIPTKMGGFFVFAEDEVNKVKSYLENNWRS
jgi:hypothetical protein